MAADICSRAQKYCEEALQWMLDCGAAKTLVVTVTRSGLYCLTIEIDATKPDASSESFTYAYNWSYQKQDSY
jgi:phage gp46-like protein